MLLSSHNTVTACPPGGNQPATIALFTDSDYNPANYNYFKSVAIKLLRESLARYGITYVDGFTTITPRSSRHGKVIIDVYVPTGVNCDTLPGFVKEMVKRSMVVTGAGLRCGTNPNVIYVDKN
ncbi:hypothetical protein Y032_0013g2162 [Ancylostoma ceylanicum]|uniref:Uncharacterized protein n=1 Tax=Ancylostoma ceylanicum TaxID=53326 RepID=A0A016VDR9_9BILA|nr:hypothetical protein Y032_0013g2162 [Ancylostoma ceylanicum]